MKNLLFVFISVLIFSCSSNSDDSPSSSNLFNPPTWIHGSWSNPIGGYKFTTNNVCQINSVSELCFKRMIEDYNSALPNSSTVNEEIISDSEYKFSYTVQSTTQYFHFVKTSNTEIEMLDTQGQGSILTKQ